MAKFNAKNLAIMVFLGVLLVGIIGIANAQQVLPKGGDDFETAVEIESGNYVTDHDISRKVPEYFKLTVGAGQVLIVKTTNLPTGVDIISHAALYNEDRVMLLPGYNNPLSNISGVGKIGIYEWLSNSSQDSYVYYMSAGGGNVNFTAEGTKYDILIENRFDAGSQTDAGDTIEKAMEIASGEYKAYLSGEAGIDTKDFYKVAVKKGKTLTIKVTPPSEAAMTVVVYDSNRAVLKSEQASNMGAIVTNSLLITKSGDVFVGVICDKYCSDNLVAYTLDVTTEGEAIADDDEDVFGTGIGAPEDKTDKGLNWWLIIGIALIIILALAIVAYFLLKKGKNSNEEQKKPENEKIIK